MEGAGAVATFAGLLAQPEINPAADATVGIGVATMLTGGAYSLAATSFQVFGGIAQMLGASNYSVGRANAFAGSVSMLTGLMAAFFGGAGTEMAGNSAAARAYNTALTRNLAFGGAGADAATQLWPGMKPLQTSCGN